MKFCLKYTFNQKYNFEANMIVLFDSFDTNENGMGLLEIISHSVLAINLLQFRVMISGFPVIPANDI